MARLFFFGSLRDSEVLEVVLARPVPPEDIIPAIAHGHAALALGHEAYPYLATRPDGAAEGVVVERLTADDLARLEYFEEAEYGLGPIQVTTGAGTVEAQCFLATERIEAHTRDVPWDFAAWQADEKPVAIEAAAELMGHFGIVPVEDIDTVWPGIMIRARMRARAKATPPVTGTLRPARDPSDIDHLSVERPYTRYFAIEEHTLRHRQFDGSLSRPVRRTVVTSGDAVTVLPYDPVRDHVLLIEQFRTPMMARGDACPWGIEVIAGRLDQENDPQACARREAREEAGLDLGPMEQIAAFYSSPGFAAEHITSFVAQADLPEGQGVFGCASEDEDIRAFALPLSDAIEGVSRGEINNGPAILSLLWLQVHRSRLLREWGQTARKSA